MSLHWSKPFHVIIRLLLPDDPDCVCNDALRLLWLCAGPNIIKGKELVPIIKDCPSASLICFDSAIAIALLHTAQRLNQCQPTDPKLILCTFGKLCNLWSMHLTCLKRFYTFKLFHQVLISPGYWDHYLQRDILFFFPFAVFLNGIKLGGTLTLRLKLEFALI